MLTSQEMKKVTEVLCVSLCVCVTEYEYIRTQIGCSLLIYIFLKDCLKASQGILLRIEDWDHVQRYKKSHEGRRFIRLCALMSSKLDL